MGLQLTLTKEHNKIYADFPNAYWAIEDVMYTTDKIGFRLYAYPSRSAKLLNHNALEDPSIGFGGPTGAGSVDCALYMWNVEMALTQVFPDGAIPAGRDAQYTAIYTWIKEFTGLPFTDVLELGQEG